ncbi:hypothetical protein ACWDG1_46435 [Streptomyces sp. NPDC001177]
MQINYSALMIAVVVVALAVIVASRGRWSGPMWVIQAGMVLAYPLSRLLAERAGQDTNGWLQWSFDISCALLVATLVGPVHHRQRGRVQKALDRPLAPPTAPPRHGS